MWCASPLIFGTILMAWTSNRAHNETVKIMEKMTDIEKQEMNWKINEYERMKRRLVAPSLKDIKEQEKEKRQHLKRFEKRQERRQQAEQQAKTEAQ